MSTPAPQDNPFQRANRRMHSMTKRARWWTALGGAALLLLLSLLCLFPGMLLAAFSSDACSSLPAWTDTLLLVPVTLVLLSILVSALLFGFRRRFQWVLTVLVGGMLLCLCSYLAWFPLVALTC